MVKETRCNPSPMYQLRTGVSIPSRGSGKGDRQNLRVTARARVSIPSRGSGKGDMVFFYLAASESLLVSIPSRGSGKGDPVLLVMTGFMAKSFNPLSGKW